LKRGTSGDCIHHNVEDDAVAAPPEDRPSISREDVALHAGAGSVVLGSVVLGSVVLGSVVISGQRNLPELAMGVDLIDCRLPDRVHRGSAE